MKRVTILIDDNFGDAPDRLVAAIACVCRSGTPGDVPYAAKDIVVALTVEELKDIREWLR